MVEDIINPKRIRDKAPYRKSMSLTEDDLMRASELERLFNSRYSSEAPFNFSKMVSKALELAILQVLQSENVLPGGVVQQSLIGLPADPDALQARQLQRQGFGNQSKTGNQIQSKTGDQPGQQSAGRSGKPKKFQKTKRGF